MTQSQQYNAPQQPYVPQQPQVYAQPPVQQEPARQAPDNSATFTADVKVLEYISMTHPEMASSMINIAIKKFAETSDFWNYFVQDQFKTQHENQRETQTTSVPQADAAPTPKVETPDLGFNAW